MAEEINLPPTAPLPATPKTPWTLPLILVLAIFSLAISGYLFWQNQILQKQLAMQTTPSTTQTLVTASPPPDPTAGWKTYENPEFGFSFKYPAFIDLKVNDTSVYFVDFSGDFQTNISWNLSDLSGGLQEELTSTDQCPLSVTNGIVSGPMANSLRCDFIKSHYPSVRIWVQNGKTVYRAEIGAINPNIQIPEKDVDLLTQILSTFKFTP